MVRFIAPSRGIYYGWYVLGVVALGAFLSAGTSQLFMSTMLQPMSAEYGWSRTAATGAITVGTLAGGFLSPWVGRLADRYGPRALTTMGGLALAATLALLAGVSELWQLYAAYIVGRAVASTTLAGVVPYTAAANWFRRLRGRALGIVSLSIPLGVSILAFVAQLIGEPFGWRAVFFTYATVTLLTLVPLAIIVLRQRPEVLGLRPDGDPPRAASAVATPASGEEASWTLGEARRTRALWLLIGASACAVLGNTAVGYQQVGYYMSRGIPATEAVVVLSTYSLAGAFGNGLWGWLTDYVSERLLAVYVMAAAAGVTAYLLFVRDLTGALVFAVLFGLTSRGESTLVGVLVAHYFGRRAYGTIQGFMQPFMMVGLGAGPFLSSVLLDLTGSYTLLLLAGTTTFLLTALLVWLSRKPTRLAPVARGVPL